MQTNITQWGNSLAIRIPKPFAQQAGISNGEQVELSVTDDQIIIRKPKYSLTELLKTVSSHNIHKEEDTGLPVGKEIW